MAEYRVPEFTLRQRTDAVLQMLDPDRESGLVSELTRLYGVSRTLLYELRGCTLDAIVEALLPRDIGRPAQVTSLRVDKAFIDRTIAILPIWKPCLTLVDGRSFLVVNLTPAESRDGTTWGVTYLDLVERGIQFHNLACDGGTGLRAGVKYESVGTRNLAGRRAGHVIWPSGVRSVIVVASEHSPREPELDRWSSDSKGGTLRDRACELAVPARLHDQAGLLDPHD